MSARDPVSCPRGLVSWTRRPLSACGILAVTLLMPLVAGAQDVTAPTLKAAFIYNFVKFTEWPVAFPAADPFVICVSGDAAVADAVGRLIKGREFAGHRMESRAVTSPPPGACHVAYVSGPTVAEAARAIAGLKDSPAMTISDVIGFTDAGGMAQFFFESGQLRFIINVDAVKRAGLKMSSRLLALGKR